MPSDSQSLTPSPPVRSANVTPEPGIRNPRIHRQSGIPSISRPLKGISSPSPRNGARIFNLDKQVTPKSVTISTPGKTNARKLKAAGYPILSKVQHAHNADNEPTTAASGLASVFASKRRHVSMPRELPSDLQAQVDIGIDRIARGLASASPPLVDFTHFEDMYRGPRIGDFEGLVPHLNRAVGKNGLRSCSTGEKPSLKTETPLMVNGCPNASVSFSGTSAIPASARKPDPRLIMTALRDILGKSQHVENYLNSFELLAAHQLDQLDFEERDAINAAFLERGQLCVKGHKGPLAVLGEPLRKASIYSSTYVVLGGREHCLPIIVVNCIEELYRTGIYQPHLFRSLPNRTRLFELISIFDSETPLPGSVIRSRNSSSHTTAPTPNAGFGWNTSLHLESTPDICALLTTYLSSLPEPILPPFMFNAVWDWCELDDDDDNNQENSRSPPGQGRASSFGRRHGLPSTVPLARTFTSPSESTHILIAQLLLQLLPSPNFSLILYLLAFFSQVALVREENGVGVEDLSRMFGGRIFGGGSISSSASQQITENRNAEDVFNTTQTRRKGEAMMSWFLRRWAPISEGLFDVIDDAKMGVFRRTLARKDSLGHDILPTWLANAGHEDTNSSRDVKRGGGIDYESLGSDGRVVEGQNARRADDGGNDGSSNRRESSRSIPLIRLEPPQSQSTPKSKKTRLWTKGNLVDDKPVVDELDIVDDYVDKLMHAVVLGRAVMGATDPKLNRLEDDTIDIARVPFVSDFENGSSASPDERLMDISLPTFFNETYPTSPTLNSVNTKNMMAMAASSHTIVRYFRTIGVQTGHIPTEFPSNHTVEATELPDISPSSSDHGKDQSSLQIIIVSLEKQLKKRSELLETIQKDLEICKAELDLRARRIEELERTCNQL